MTAKRPPRMATWILKHFGSGSHIDELLGDLAEQYVQQGSASWYWRQTLKALPVSFVREIRANKWNAASRLVTGWVFWILGGMVVFPWVFYGTDPTVSFAFTPSDPIGSAMTFVSQPALAFPGVHPQGSTGIAAFAFAALMPLLVGIVSGGWLGRWQISAQTDPPMLRLSRVERDKQISVILLFAGSVLFVNLLPYALSFGPAVSYRAALLGTNAAASVLGILLGAGVFRKRG